MKTRAAEARAGYIFAMPWIIGFSIFLAYPIFASIYFSFTEYSVLKPAVWTGGENYGTLANDEVFWKTLKNTLFFAVFFVPVATFVALGLALLLNTKVRFLAIYRTIFFVPSLVPVVSLVILWLWMFNGEYGLINTILGWANPGLTWIFRLLFAPLVITLLGAGIVQFVVPVVKQRGALKSFLPYLAGACVFWAIGVRFNVPVLRSINEAVANAFGLQSGSAQFQQVSESSSLGLTWFLWRFLTPVVLILAVTCIGMLVSQIFSNPRCNRKYWLVAGFAAIAWAVMAQVGLPFALTFNDVLASWVGLPQGFDSILPQPNWLGDPKWSKPAIIFMSTWGVGNAMIIYLAGLQEVPQSLYDAADIDGANPWKKTINVTIPLLSPVIMFNVIMSIIGSLQIFTQPYIMSETGSPARSIYFYSMYLFDNAFKYHKMGYASAMAWIMFIIIFGLTLLAIKVSNKYVHYEGG